jgi:hypothetical protein
MPIVLAMLLGLATAIVAVQVALRRYGVLTPPRGFRRSRVFRMLGLRGIAPDDYLRANSIASVKLHLRLCEDCADGQRCDATAQSGGIGDFSYCPNGASLDRLLRGSVAIGRRMHSEFTEPLVQPGSKHRRSTR